MTKQNEIKELREDTNDGFKIVLLLLVITIVFLILAHIRIDIIRDELSSVPHKVCENVIVSSKPINEYTYHIWESLVPYFNINEKMYNVSYEIIEKRIDCAEINETFVDGHIERNLNTTKCPVKYIKYSMNELKEVCKWE